MEPEQQSAVEPRDGQIFSVISQSLLDMKGKRIRVIPQDDGLMDLWIAGLLGLSSRKSIEIGF
jgi:hypothetical protein